jgi:hypothetical protein
MTESRITNEGGGVMHKPSVSKTAKATDTKGIPPKPRTFHKPAKSGHFRPFTNRAR